MLYKYWKSSNDATNLPAVPTCDGVLSYSRGDDGIDVVVVRFPLPGSRYVAPEKKAVAGSLSG